MELTKVKNTIEKYLEKFDDENPKIAMKKEHLKNVSQVSKEIAKALKLNDEQIKLCQIIGMLHDIGRFEQIKEYNTFSDKDSFDHSTLGCKILFEKGLIKELDIDKKYYTIIEKAIINHNVKILDKNLTCEEKLYTKILRDADKIDILKTSAKDDLYQICGNLENDVLSAKLVNTYINDINYKDIKTPRDIILSQIAYVYDLNFSYSAKYILENKFLEQINAKLNQINNNNNLQEHIILAIEHLKYMLSSYDDKFLFDLDYSYCLKQFKDYALEFEQSPRVLQKTIHCTNVASFCEQIAIMEKLSDVQISVAKIIGQYHDVSRFKEDELKRKNILPKDFDHGVESAKLLKEQTEKFFSSSDINSPDFSYILDIICEAIINHNTYCLEEQLCKYNLSDKTKLNQIKIFSKLIRDADKLDIFRQTNTSYFKNIDSSNYGTIDKNYLLQIQDKKCILKNKEVPKTYENSVLFFLSLVYDLNYKSSFKILKDKKYIENIVYNFEFSDENKNIILTEQQKVLDYIDEKAK